MTNDPYLQLWLSLFGIAWSAWGVFMYFELFSIAPSFAWKIFLFIFGGPCVWAVGTCRGIKAARRWALHKVGAPDCGCCGKH